MFNKITKIVIGFLFGVMVSSLASAAPILNFNGNVLTSASGVMLDGTSYDVKFTDGTCVALFNGCTQSSVFVLKSETDSFNAALALRAQVFNNPSIQFFVAGCESETCIVMHPYFLSASMEIYGPQNHLGLDTGGIWGTGFSPTFDTAVDPTITYSLWSVTAQVIDDPRDLPEPATGALFALAGIVLFGLRRPRRK